MPPASPDEQELSRIKKETEELERHVNRRIAQGDRTLHELHEIKERLAKLDEEIAALKRSLLLRDLGA